MTKDIVLCFDRFFVKPIMVLLKSIEISNPGEQFIIHIVFSGEGKKDSLKALLQDVVSQEMFTFNFYEIDDKLLSSCPIRKGDYVNISTYYRILLPALLPETVERVLYLDGDMLVVDGISELWDINLDNYGAAVVPCIHYDNPNEFIRLGLDVREGYFNAGFMLINLNYWRNHDIQNKTLAFIQDYPDRCKKHDQDALNYILSGKLLYLSICYNFQRIFYEKDFLYSKKLVSDVNTALNKICIVHYCDLEKPWHRECFHPLKDVWIYVARKIPNLNFKMKYKYTGMRKVKFIIKNFLTKLGLIKKSQVEYTVNFEKISKNLTEELERL